MPFITNENAKELAQRSAETRRLIKQYRTRPQANQPNEQRDYYTVKRLSRVRRQIDSLSNDLDAETDATKKDRLASAISRLSEIERQLANRPLPGSWKPTQAPKKRPWTGDTGPTPIPEASNPSVVNPASTPTQVAPDASGV